MSPPPPSRNIKKYDKMQHKRLYNRVLRVLLSPGAPDPAPRECVRALEVQPDRALRRQTGATTILAPVRARRTVQVQTTHEQSKPKWGEFVIINNVLCCASVQSSVTERPPTAGVWTRTDGRSPGPDRTTSSNLRVGFYWSVAARVCQSEVALVDVSSRG